MAVIAAAGVAAYWDSFSNPFVFDDNPSIAENPTIRSLWPLTGPLGANFHDGRPVDGRPILNLSFAVNYALHGSEVWGYHVGNLLLHILAGWTLFAILKRTFQSGVIPSWLRNRAEIVATCVALLWTVHPLQTAAVTYMVQRGEVLASLFYLLALYGFIRGAEAGRGRVWFSMAVTSCLFGMAAKEMMVTAPVIIFLYDRTFLAGTFREAWRRRWPWHLALASTWLLLAWLIVRSGARDGVADFAGQGMSTGHYLLTQCGAVVRYFGLVFWPGPLVFDYGTGVVKDFGEVATQAVFLLALGLFTLWAVWKKPVLGFALAWIAIILSPSSSVVPLTTQTIAEQRMYLPLAAVLALAVGGLFRFLPGRSPVIVCGLLAIGLATRTAWRNTDYRSAFSIWSDTARKWPSNVRAHWSAGAELVKAGRSDAAMPWLLEAVRLAPQDASALDSLGTALVAKGDYSGAAEKFMAAIQARPDQPHFRVNAANALMLQSRWVEAGKQLNEALRLDSECAEAHGGMGLLLAANGNSKGALAHFEKAVEINPESPDFRNNLGMALAQSGRPKDAAEQFREALRLEPGFQRAKANLNQLEATSK